MFAVKGNIEYSINESEKEAYIKKGFDIYKDGKKIADGEHKTVSYAEYKKLKDEFENLKNTQIDKKEADKLLGDLASKDKEIVEKNELIESKDKEIAELKATITTKDEEIKKLKK